MSANRSTKTLCRLLLVLLFAAQAFAQMTVTGSISGNVMDPSNTAVPNAKVTLISEKTKEIRETTSNDSGAFSLVAVQPDTYAIRVERSGFKIFERTGIVISANERIALGQIVLQVGAVTETVTISAQVAHVETDSSEQSAEISSDQIGNLTAR